MPGFHAQHTGRLLTKVAAAAAAPLVVRSGHLGHTQVCECQLEVALVEHFCSYFLAARASDLVQLVYVPLPGFNAVEGRRRHGATGRAVEQQAGTAESLELLECGQDSRLVETDAWVDLIRADLDPGGSDTGTLILDLPTAVARAMSTLRGRFPHASLNALILTEHTFIAVHASATSAAAVEDMLVSGIEHEDLPLDHIDRYFLMRWRRGIDGTDRGRLGGVARRVDHGRRLGRHGGVHPGTGARMEA